MRHMKEMHVLKILLILLNAAVLVFTSNAFAADNGEGGDTALPHALRIITPVLLTETRAILNPYNAMTQDQFSEAMGTLMKSRDEPYYAVSGNIVYYGTVYYSIRGGTDYTGIWQIIWNNNDLPMQPICGLRTGMARTDVLSTLLAHGVLATQEDMSTGKGGDSDSLELSCPVPTLGCQYRWTFDFTDGVLTRILFYVTQDLEPDTLWPDAEKIPILFGGVQTGLCGWLLKEDDTAYAMLPLTDLLALMGYPVQWVDNETGTVRFGSDEAVYTPWQHSLKVKQNGPAAELLLREDPREFREQFRHRQRFASSGRHLWVDSDTIRNVLPKAGYTILVNNTFISIERSQ